MDVLLGGLDKFSKCPGCGVANFLSETVASRTRFVSVPHLLLNEIYERFNLIVKGKRPFFFALLYVIV